MNQDATRDELHQVRDELKSDIRGIGVMFERLDSRISLLAEGILNVRDELKADIRATEERLTERIVTLEEVARQNSADIRENRIAIFQNREAVVENRHAIRENREAIEQVRQDVDDVRKRI